MTEAVEKQDSAEAGALAKLVEELEASLTRQYGRLLPQAALRHELGYPTAEALRKALIRKRLPIPTFKIEGRKGHFALTRDFAHWLAQRRAAADHTSQTEATM